MKYKAKSVVIEAIQFDGTKESAKNIEQWTHDMAECFRKNYPLNINEFILRVTTPEGEMTANPTDWIIKGTEGEFYPCKDSVFKTRYEVVE